MKELKLKLVAYDVYRQDEEDYTREDIIHTEYFDEQSAWDFVHTELLELYNENMPPYDERDKILPKNEWLFANEDNFEKVMAMTKEEYEDTFEENIGWWNKDIERFTIRRTTNLVPYSTVLENLINTDAEGWVP